MKRIEEKKVNESTNGQAARPKVYNSRTELASEAPRLRREQSASVCSTSLLNKCLCKQS